MNWKKKTQLRIKLKTHLLLSGRILTAQMIFCAELQEGLQKFIKNQSCREPGIGWVSCYDQDINKPSFKF